MIHTKLYYSKSHVIPPHQMEVPDMGLQLHEVSPVHYP